MTNETDGAGKTPQLIIIEHYRKMAEKSHATVKARYGKDFYRRIKQDYWNKKKQDKTLEVKLK